MFTETRPSLPAVGSQIQERFFQWIVYSNLWVASGITSLIVFVQHSLGLAWDWRPYGLIFSAALIPYILDRAVDTVVQPIPNPQVQDRFRTVGIWVLLAVALACTGGLIYQATAAVGWVCLGGLVPLIYGLPIFPRWRQGEIRWYRLKDIPGAKAWLVCGSITYGVVAVPVAYAGVEVDAQVILTALFLLMFVGTNSHVFDVRDLDSDREAGVKTMPVLVGVEATRVILTCLNGTMLAILASAWIQGVTAPDPLLVCLATGISLGYLWVLTPETSREAYHFWVDGCLFLPALLSLLR